jgi:predicted DNA-binding transcriptional regulator AlpA
MTTDSPQKHRHIPSSSVREMCGGISDMSLWRWCKHSDFPQPVRINRRRYWKEQELIEWLERQRQDA